MGLRCENALPKRWFDLRGADFSGETLFEIDLNRTNLCGANFDNADLETAI